MKSNFEKCIFLIAVLINVLLVLIYSEEILLQISYRTGAFHWLLGSVPFFKEHLKKPSSNIHTMNFRASCFHFYFGMLTLITGFLGQNVCIYFLWLVCLLLLTFNGHKAAIDSIFKLFPE